MTHHITAGDIQVGDELNLAGTAYIVVRRVHGAWYLDCPGAAWIEFELGLATGARTCWAGTNGRSILRLAKAAPVTVERPRPDDPAELTARLTNRHTSR